MNFGRPATFGGASTGGFGAAGGFAPAAQNTAFGGAQNTAFGSPTQGSNTFGGGGFGATKPAFGAPQQPATGFGGGAFGATNAAPVQTNQFGAFGQQQPQNNAFGANKTFGSPGGGFGATSQQQATPFGAATGGFGQPQQQQQGTFGQGGVGQQQQTAATPFGQPFGANKAVSTPATGFGSLAKPGGFGQPQATPAFGQTAPLFGQPAAQHAGQQPMFGQQPAVTPFGQQSAATPFGQQPSTTPFGQQSAATPFGAPATGAFGATGGFGQAASNPFNQTATTGAFGSATSTNAPAFGQPQQQQQQAGFNIAPTLGGGFGQTTGLGGFGAMGQNQQAGGTGNPPFRPITITESTKSGQSILTLQAISGMNEYKHKSFEELHWEDFQKGNKGGTPVAANPMGQIGAFGSALSPQKSFTTNTAFGAPAFGVPAQQPAAANTFGSPSLGGFGSPSAPTVFGQQPTATTTPGFGTAGAFGSTSAFGSATTPGGFGGLAKPAAFGSPTSMAPVFGQPAAGAAPAFGQPLGSASTSFGQSLGVTNTAFGASTAGGLGGFGQTTPSFGKPAAGALGGFGQPPSTPSAFGSTLGGGTISGFGQLAAPAATGGFGQPATSFGSFSGTTNGFGGGGMLGGATGGFGVTQSQQMNSFQMNPQMQQQQMLQQQQQQMQLPPPPVTPSVEHKIDLLLKKSHDMASNTGNLTSKEDQAKADQAQQSLSSPSIILAGLDIGRSKHFSRNTPLSSAKVLSRGIRSNNHVNTSNGSQSTVDSLRPPNGSSASFSTNSSFNSNNQYNTSTGAYSSSSGLFSPTSHVGSAKKLVLSSFGTPSSHSVNRALPPPAWRTPAKMNTHTPAKTPMNDDVHNNMNSVSGGRNDNDSMLVTPSTNLKVHILEGLSSVSKVQSAHDSIVMNMSNKINNAVTTSEINWPTLRRDGYETSPSMSVLRTMTEEQLSQVSHFTVIRKNFGKIEWLVPVDIRGEDLDSAVVIEASAVAVYESDTPESTENDRDNVPKRGERLNNPARITLENVWPKNKDLSQEKLKAYEKKLKDFCVANEAKFVSYDGQRGVWIFEVDHFSRYAFVDDDDDEENESNDQQQQQQSNHVSEDYKNTVNDSGDQVSGTPAVEELLSSPHVKTSFEKLRSALFTDCSHSNVDSDVNALAVVEKNDISATPSHMIVAVSAKGRHRHANRFLKTPLLDAHDANACSTIPDFSAHFHRPIPVPAMIFEQDQRYSAKYRQDFQRITNQTRAFFLPEQSPTIRHLIETKQLLLGISSNTPGCTTKSLELQLQTSQINKKIEKKDLLLFMGRSNRVGFTLDGRIAHVGSVISHSSEGKDNDRDEMTRCHRLVIERLQVTETTVSSKPLMLMTGEIQRDNSAISVLQRCIAAIHSVAEHVSRGVTDNFCPFWIAPKAITRDLPQYNRFATCLDRLSRVFSDTSSISSHNSSSYTLDHPDWLLFTAIEAVRGGTGQERVLPVLQSECDYMPLSDNDYISHPELSERRRLFMQQWLMSATVEISKQSPVNTGDVFDRAFHRLVSGCDVHGAVFELQSQGQFRLASLVAQVGGDADSRVLLRQQLQLWRDMEVLSQFPSGLRKLYTLLAAPLPSHLFAPEQQKQQDDFEVELLTEMFAGLHWMQCLAVLCWYFPTHHTAPHLMKITEDAEDFLETGTFAESLTVYRQLLKMHILASPIRPVRKRYNMSAQTDGVYSLLCAMFLGDDVSSALDMYGMATHDLDFHTNYVLITLLEGLQLLSCESVVSVSVRQLVVSQLLSQPTPLVFEALFVLSQIPETAGVQGDASAGVGAAAFLREVLQRCAVQVSEEVQHRLCLPAPLVAEAIAYFSAYYSQCAPRHHPPVDVLQALMEAGQMAQVAQMLCLHRCDLFDTVHDTSSKTQKQAVTVTQALQIADWILTEDAKVSALAYASVSQTQKQPLHENSEHQRSSYLLLGCDRTWIDVVRLLRDYFAVRDAADHLLSDFGTDILSTATSETGRHQDILAATQEVATETQRVLERIVRFYKEFPARVAYVSRFHPQFHALWCHMATFCYELLAKLYLHMHDDDRARDYSVMNASEAAVLFQSLSQLCFAPQSQTGKGLVDRRVCKATVEYAIRGFAFNAASTLVL